MKARIQDSNPCRPATPPTRSDSGLTMIETLMAMGILAVAALVPLSTMVTTSGVDHEMRGRATALRAALARMEAVLAFDDGGDRGDFEDFWTLPRNAFFTIPGLARLETPATAGQPGTDAIGHIVVDGTDPLRVKVSVIVDWSQNLTPRSLTLPMTLTGLVP